MLVHVQEGDRCECEVTAIFPGKYFEVSLESGETAHLPWGNVKGMTDADKLDRALSLAQGSKLSVNVINVYQGRDFKNKISVREVGWRRSVLPSHVHHYHRGGNTVPDPRRGMRIFDGKIRTWRR